MARLPEAGEEIVFDPLTVLTSRVELRELVALLEAEKIPYILHAGTGLQMMDTQTLRSLARRRDWEARVMVVSSRFEEARAALRSAQESVEDEKREEQEEEEELDAAEEAEAEEGSGFDSISPDPIRPR